MLTAWFPRCVKEAWSNFYLKLLSNYKFVSTPNSLFYKHEIWKVSFGERRNSEKYQINDRQVFEMVIIWNALWLRTIFG